jgi:hypothetical protein
MAFFMGRFDPIDGVVDDEVRKLYRRREYDQEYKNKKGALVDRKIFGVNPDMKNDSMNRFGAVKSTTDDIYSNMTEEERVENGLPTKWRVFLLSPHALGLVCIWGGINLLKILLNINYIFLNIF